MSQLRLWKGAPGEFHGAGGLGELRWWCGWLMLSALFACAWPLATPLWAASPLDATSNRKARQEAIHAIPWRHLTNQQRRAVQTVVTRSSIYRRLPTRVIDCDAELFTFLMQHPEVVADTWRTMGVSNVKIDRAGERTYLAQDGLGTKGRFSYFDSTYGEAAANRLLIYAEGGFEGKPFKQPINARCVLLLRSGSVQETNGRTYITARMDSFLLIEQLGVEILAKTVHPLVGKAADQNFTETLDFISTFSRAAERNPAGVEEFSRRLDGVDEETRNELVRVCYTTAQRYKRIRQDRLQDQLTVVPAITTSATP